MIKELVAQFCVVYGCASAEPPKVTSVNSVGAPLKACTRYLKHFKHANNVSLIMAQAEQESRCNPMASSRFADGVMQFTPSTRRWAGRSFCKSLGVPRKRSARWSIRCGIKYMEWLQARSPYKANFKLNYTVALMRYNGGGHVLKELRRSKSNNLTKARKHCRRARWACKENYEYAPRIFKKQPKYARYDNKQR